MGITETLAGLVAGTRYGDFPPPVIHEAKRAILDSLGVALGACRHPTIDILLDLYAEMGGRGQATILGRGIRTNVPLAGLANGTMAHILDYDDTLLPSRLHPSTPLVPALLALGEERGARGPDLLTAFILGFEIEARLAEAMFPAHADRGWHGTGTLGALAVAGGAGKMLGASPEALGRAMAIAATQASGLIGVFGTMCKPLNLGKAAMHGLLSAALAARGFTGPPDILEARFGFCEVFAGGWRPEPITQGWGERWAIVDNGYKPYPCGVVIHPLIDALLQIRAAHGVRPDAVAEVAARVNPYALILTGKTEPQTGLEGKFSLYHAAAVSLIDGKVRPEQFTDARVRDPAAVDLRRRVRAEADPAVRQDEVRATVTLRDGRRLEAHVAHASGTRGNPLSDADLVAKFRDLVEPALGVERAEALRAAVWSLDANGGAGDLARLAAGHPQSS